MFCNDLLLSYEKVYVKKLLSFLQHNVEVCTLIDLWVIPKKFDHCGSGQNL